MNKDSLHFERLLSSRARIGWGGPVGTQRPTSNALYEFGGGFPDPESFPYEGMIEATKQMMTEEGAAAMTYGEPLGYKGLRELIVHKYELFEGLKVPIDNIIVTNGSGHALAMVFSTFLDTGDTMITETPAFSGTLVSLRRHGPRIVEVPIDNEGIQTSVLREKLATLKREGTPCKLIYTIVNFQNPAGPTQSLRRRHELVELANEFDTLILEDDAYGELRFDGEMLPSLYELDKNKRTIRAGTLSKILGAGVRLGWLLAPKEMIPAFQGFLFGGGVNPYVSRVATYYMRDHMAGHVARLVEVYRTKRDAMLKGLWEVLSGTDVQISKPEGGFFIWIKLPTGTDTAKLSKLAAEGRVQYTPGANFFPNGGGEQHIRLAFSYETPEKCYEGARVIAKAIMAAR